MTKLRATAGIIALILLCPVGEVTSAADGIRCEQVLQLGGFEIRNIGTWTASTRKNDRPADLWLHYMHGVVDHFATPVAWEDLFGPGQDPDKWLVPGNEIDIPYKKSNVPAVRLVGESSLSFQRPLPIAPEAIRGKWIRIFAWLKGDDVGARNNCWHAPSMYVTMKDADGNTLSASDSLFKTLRTYPWHCYYTDRFVPEEAAGVYVRLFNKFHGKAWFSTLSWEYVTDANAYDINDKQDPSTGSCAFNPKYDEMPEHLKYGTLSAHRHKWTFVRGANAGLIGQPYDITTKEGFRQYYFEKAKREPEHMNHAILYMQSMYRNGVRYGLLPPMEEGWLDNFAQILITDQDPETGFWHDGVSLSLGLTFHLCDMHFRYYSIPREDREDRIYAGQDLGLKRVPRADRIIRSVLMMQSSCVDADGKRHKAAWNYAAYRYTTEPDAYEQKCYLGTTWDAIYLARLASRYVDEDLQKQVYESVKAAFLYVLRECVFDDGTFKQRDTDRTPTESGYMYGIMQDSHWLERRIRPWVHPPSVSLQAREDGACVLTWKSPSAGHNSVRIYVVPEGTPAEQVNESHLAGVIHRTGHCACEMDPLLAVQKIRAAMTNRWGTSAELPPPEHWRGKKYLPWKLRMIKYPLPHSDDLQPLVMDALDLDGRRVFVSAATWYGEESPPRPLELK